MALPATSSTAPCASSMKSKNRSAVNLGQLLTRKRELDRQAEMLDAARRLLRYWHILHVPVGLTLFFSVTIHIVATFYFRAGLF